MVTGRRLRKLIHARSRTARSQGGSRNQAGVAITCRSVAGKLPQTATKTEEYTEQFPLPIGSGRIAKRHHATRRTATVAGQTSQTAVFASLCGTRASASPAHRWCSPAQRGFILCSQRVSGCKQPRPLARRRLRQPAISNQFWRRSSA